MSFACELAAARRAAELASELIRREYRTFEKIDNPDISISTHVDRASQEVILQLLHTEFPEDALCAEEATPLLEQVPSTGRRVWVVDPIDGTRGFVKKIGQFSVMIALVVDGQPVVGVVAEPAKERLTYASMGEGCWVIHGQAAPQRCQVSMTQPEDGLTLIRSHSKDAARPDAIHRALQPQKLLTTYSGGVKLAMVARGEGDVYVNDYSHFADWDIAAGHILVTEAGGKVTTLRGGPVQYLRPGHRQTEGLLASNGRVHDAVVAKLGSVVG